MWLSGKMPAESSLMSESALVFKRVAIAAHPQLPIAFKVAEGIANFLEDRGIKTIQGSLYDEDLRYQAKIKEIDLWIALGGDGTMLRAGHLCAPYKIPILGINLGKFGFLTAIQRDEWRSALIKLLDGEGWIEERMMLTAEHVRAGEKKGSWNALNEAAVSRAAIIRPVHLDTYVDGRFLTTYVADGLIAATPTGSTAYALAAGGPILPPDLRNILLVPVAPHLSIDRAIVLAEGSDVTITVHTDHQAVICIDGKEPIPLLNGDQVHIKASKHTVQFVRIQDPGYFYRNLTPHMNNHPATGTSK
jgi:NAD+ kinase